TRGAARARRQRRVRPVHVGLLPHDGSACAGGCGCGGGLPAMTNYFAAVALGATSGRVMVAAVAPGSIELHGVTRCVNDPVYLWNGRRAAMHWNLPGLFGSVCDGLAEATRRRPDLAGIGVDSWAVDYGLLRGGALT